MFTDHAIERMRKIAVEPGEKQELAALFSVIDAATGPADLRAALPGTVQLVKGERGKMFVVRSGRLRAVVTIDPSHPDQMVVASVYRADEEEAEGDALRLAAEKGEDVALTR